jgi:F-type H+-transporting ATPase subunit epsilon
MLSIKVEIVSASEELYSGEAKMVFAPASQGGVGIMPKHTPLLTTLKPGEVKVETVDGEMHSIYVSGGILEIQPDIVTILSDTAIRAKDLDEAKALKAKEEAEAILENQQNGHEVATAESALAEAMAQLQMISKMRNNR